jgi:hypothetical protein
VRADQHIEQVAGRALIDAAQGRSRVGVEVGSRVQAQHAEEPGGIRGQRTVGPGEHGAHCVGFLVVLGRESVPQSRLVAQVADQIPQRHHRPASRPLGRDPQRERQAGT